MIGIYARVSTEDQARRGFSISDQVRQAKAKAKSNDVKEYIDDGYSGEFLDRPALTQLRQDIRDGIITQVICYDPDRLSRKLMNQLIITDEFEKRGVEIIFVSGEYQRTPEGALFYQMRGAIAEFEKAKINERMSRGRREKAKQGKIVRDYQVYGYGYDKETASMYINESEAAIVKLIFDLFTKPNTTVKGINGIANYLTENGVPTKKGGHLWHKQVVRQMLFNRCYTGEFYQNRWNTEGMLGNKYRQDQDKIPMKLRPKEEWIPIEIPAIIDQMQFEHAQKLLAESKRRFAKDSLNKYLLSGLVRCGECGNTMTGRKSKNWGKYIFEYSDVKNTAGSKNKGCGMRVSCEELDSYVWETIHNYLNNPDEIAAASETEKKETFESSEISRIQKRIESIKSGRKRLLKLFSTGVQDIGEEEVREELRQLKEEEESLTEKVITLQKQSELLRDSEYSKKLMSEAVDYYLNKNSDELTFDDKQKIIRHIVQEIRVYKDHIDLISF